ncbi:alpha-1,4-glucan--maltose-1-phosphate maltosyltransferase [Altererythrobacter sp. B11]|uniref:alpha-1,4-glucan--maltose-1-phosphate maltosyltransferase n=1 Tax=Altererythrobacter sp. B11 TaxID=2060312 RepID=UPI000DC72A87|nr:alpha-1,4-glucan--maltose-1-phosphate maltosyltransferase [Altererythrobacter sp. B11]BBC73438.1 alpha-1,4-glucan--maltose-1-phosphate maltosyltransferase [Altererythrobacter sp. B11]
MPASPISLLRLREKLAVDQPDNIQDILRQAAALGYEGVLLPGTLSLHSPDLDRVARLADHARQAGGKPIVTVDLAAFPLTHPAVSDHPDLFVSRRQGQDAGAVDPRHPLPPSGEARARLHAPEAVDALGEVVGGALARLVTDSAASGVLVRGGSRMNPQLLATVLTQASHANPDLIVLLEGIPSDSDAAERLIAAGSSGFLFDIAEPVSPALLDKLSQLRARVPLLCDASTNLPVAAVVGSGILAPQDWLANEGGREALARAQRILAEARSYPGELRSIAPSSRVIALLAAERADLRTSDKALIIVANTTNETQPIPDRAQISATTGAFSPADWGNDLAPHEVRLLHVNRQAPIQSKVDAGAVNEAARGARLVIDRVEPTVDGGAFPIKRVVGEAIPVEATIFADGHELLAAELHWRAADETEWRSVRMEPLANDRWRSALTPERLGRHEFAIEAWLDRFGAFQRDFSKKVAAGVAQPVDRAEGQALVERALARSSGDLARELKKRVRQLGGAEEESATELLLSHELRDLMDRADDRPHKLTTPSFPLEAERIEARFSSWYEIFPRSMTDDPARHGTFADVVNHLPRIRGMGFDTLYFPPIHPIGRTNRKGPNNTLTPGPDDPGSPYAIGSAEGGHDAIHPELGSFEDFDRLVRAAAEHGLEIALDFAIQASPDHPWLKEHPGWFAWLPDGSMKYAENPPKKYQDIVNVDFYGPDAVPGLWEALRDVVLLWVSHGVKTFRVDNPHTKPLPFWEWMIGEVRAQHPEVIFLSEAFTRPAMMYRLAKAGFSQSYTYFTWRDRKQELTEYITELTEEAPKEFYRPHFFVNTPDINPFFLQTGGRPAHRIRAVLAATLSGLWGVYSGFELCDATPLGPGKEEYLDSEKFQIRVRDWQAPGNIIEDITTLNQLRRTYAALQTHLNTRFYVAHDDNVIWYGKPSGPANAPLGEMIMVMVNLDPHQAHGCDFEVPLWEFALPDHGTLAVEDLVGGYRFDWQGKIQNITLSPDEPYRIWRLSLAGGAA